MPIGKLEKTQQYFFLRVANEAGGTEGWLLTPNEVERIRERGVKNRALFPAEPLPAPAPPPEGFVARWLRWLRT